ncbi:MAG: hypothetical protein LUH54_04285, partial [Firmicutes bacterium]|nr:hypothetical protein [Bacillota bacterium]
MTQIKDTRAAPAPRLDKILDLLPTAVRAYVKSAADKAIFSSGEKECISEIRLRVGGVSSVTARGLAYPIGITLTDAYMDEIIHALTDGSLYAHAETIRDGYIFSHGIR